MRKKGMRMKSSYDYLLIPARPQPFRAMNEIASAERISRWNVVRASERAFAGSRPIKIRSYVGKLNNNISNWLE